MEGHSGVLIADPDEAARKAEMVRQANLAERMRELELERAEQVRRSVALLAKTKAQEVAAMRSYSDEENIQSRLRSRHELRRAVILREILGPPVGLR